MDREDKSYIEAGMLSCSDMNEEMVDGKLIVYRVGQSDDFSNGLFFADSKDYYAGSATGYDVEKAKAFELDLNGAKVFDPKKEWGVTINSWSDIRQTQEFFDSVGLDGYEWLDGVDYEDPNSYHEVYTYTDEIAFWAKKHGYDAVIFEDIPQDIWDDGYTEYCVFNKNLVKPVGQPKLKEAKGNIRVGDEIPTAQAKEFYNRGYIDLVAVAPDGSEYVVPAWHSKEAQRQVSREVSKKNGKDVEVIKGTKADIPSFEELLKDIEDAIGSEYRFITRSPEGNRTYQNEIEQDVEGRKTGKAYKLFKVINGKLYPPMVKNPGNKDTPVGVWIKCGVSEFEEISAGWGKPQVSGNALSFRPGWHLGDLPYAPQFESRTNPGYMSDSRFIWAECLYDATIDYQDRAMSYGYTKSGGFTNSAAGLPYRPEGGYYKYRTNPNPETIAWVITGSMKVNRLLSDKEVEAICKENGVPYLKRPGGDKTPKELGIQESLKEEFQPIANSTCTELYTENVHDIVDLFKVTKDAWRGINATEYGQYILQDAKGNKTHGDLARDAFKDGWITEDELEEINIWAGFVFFPKGYDKDKIRYKTKLGVDGYKLLRTYPFGTIYVRFEDTFNDPLFDALGKPDAEASYDSFEHRLTVTKDGETKEYDTLTDIDGELESVLGESLTEAYDDKTKDRDGREFRIWTESTGGYGDQSDYMMVAYVGDNWIGDDDKIISKNILGYLQYAEIEDSGEDDGIYIQMIEVKDSERRKGIGTEMIKSLYRNNPGKSIYWGLTTKDGTAFRNALKQRGEVNIEEGLDRTNKTIHEDSERARLIDIANDIVEDSCDISKSPVGGSAYILRDGRFAYPRGMEHNEFEAYMQEENEELYDFGSGIMTSLLGAVQVNSGLYSTTSYLIVPKKLTREQGDAILDWYVNEGSMFNLVVHGIGNEPVLINKTGDGEDAEQLEALVKKAMSGANESLGRIDESKHDMGKFDLWEFESPYQMRDFLIGQTEPMRVFIDQDGPVYLACKTYEATHSDMYDAYCTDGYADPSYIGKKRFASGGTATMDDFDPEQLCLIFVQNYDDVDFDEMGDAVYDDYTTCYEYPEYRIYVREYTSPFTHFDLYKAFGEPDNVRDISSKRDESLKESQGADSIAGKYTSSIKPHRGFILKDGSFVDLDNSAHNAFIFDMAVELGLDIDPDDEDAYDEFEDSLGWVRVTSDGVGLVECFDNPTESQYSSILKWLDLWMSFNDSVEVACPTSSGWKNVFYSFDETLPEDIVKKIRACFAGGTLRENSINEKIVRKGSKWQVQSEDGKKNLGTYDTKAEAEKRLKQVHYFKHVNEGTDQQAFFRDSKVRDANGDLMVCCHGSDSEIEKFDYKYIDDDGKDGYGFYFTLGKPLQFEYEHEYGCYLNIKKPMYDSDELFGDMLERELELRENGLEAESIINTISNEFDIDGIIDESRGNAVCFFPNQIKSIDNKNPTESDSILEDRSSQNNYDEIISALEKAYKPTMEAEPNRGPSYLLRDGRFLYLDNFHVRAGTDAYYNNRSMHSDEREYLILKCGFDKHDVAEALNEYFRGSLDNNDGAYRAWETVIRIDSNTPPTPIQYQQLKKWVESIVYDPNGREYINVVAHSPNPASELGYGGRFITDRYQKYQLDGIDAEYIIDRIKKYYSIGRLVEGVRKNDLHEDYDFSTVHLSDADKAELIGRYKKEFPNHSGFTGNSMYLIPDGTYLDLGDAHCNSDWVLEEFFQEKLGIDEFDAIDAVYEVDGGRIPENILGFVHVGNDRYNYIGIPKNELTAQQYNAMNSYYDYHLDKQWGFSIEAYIERDEYDEPATRRAGVYYDSDVGGFANRFGRKIDPNGLLRNFYRTGSFKMMESLRNRGKAITESKQDIERFRQWAGDDLADRFLKLKDRMSGKEKDIYYWMGLEKSMGKHGAIQELLFKLREIERTPTKREKEKEAREGTTLLYNKDGWKVYKIETLAASQKYGKNTTWCISGENGYDAGDYWAGHEDCTYFFIHGDDKYALIWNKGSNWWTIYNEMDEIIPAIPNAPKVDGLPDVSALPKVLCQKVADSLGINPESITSIESADNDPDLMDLFLDFGSHENYVVEADGRTYYVIGKIGYYEDVTQDILEFIDNE